MQLAFDLHVEATQHTPQTLHKPWPTNKKRTPQRGESVQESFDVYAEARSDIDKRIETLLRQYRYLDSMIAGYEEWACGDNLPIEMRITALLQVEEDKPEILWRLATEPLTAADEETVRILRKYLPDAPPSYASAQWAAKELDKAIPLSGDHRDTIEASKALFTDRYDEWMPTHSMERIVFARTDWINKARQKLPILKDKKIAVDYTLDRIQRFAPDYYVLLWYRYVMREDVKQVCLRLHISEDQYEHAAYGMKRKALDEFRIMCHPAYVIET